VLPAHAGMVRFQESGYGSRGCAPRARGMVRACRGRAADRPGAPRARGMVRSRASSACTGTCAPRARGDGPAALEGRMVRAVVLPRTRGDPPLVFHAHRDAPSPVTRSRQAPSLVDGRSVANRCTAAMSCKQSPAQSTTGPSGSPYAQRAALKLPPPTYPCRADLVTWYTSAEPSLRRRRWRMRSRKSHDLALLATVPGGQGTSPANGCPSTALGRSQYPAGRSTPSSSAWRRSAPEWAARRT
jgi:hypothetical protein